MQQKSSRLCILQNFVTTIEKQKIGCKTIIKIKPSNKVIPCQTQKRLVGHNYNYRIIIL